MTLRVYESPNAYARAEIVLKATQERECFFCKGIIKQDEFYLDISGIPVHEKATDCGKSVWGEK